jgi:hypothetical protein
MMQSRGFIACAFDTRLHLGAGTEEVFQVKTVPPLSGPARRAASGRLADSPADSCYNLADVAMDRLSIVA